MDLQALINEAAQNKDWIILIAASIALFVPIVLKAFGKSIPVVDQALDLAIKALLSFRKKPEAPPAKGKEGIEAVLPVEKKDK